MTAGPALWGVARYAGPDGPVAWPVSEEEIQRDMASAVATFGELGIGKGDLVLFCSTLPEAAHFWPFMVAAMAVGAQLSCADATEGDAMRVAMFTRLLRYRAVLGVDACLLDGLDELGRDYAEVFGDVAMLGARPCAFDRLVHAGLTPHHFALVGPAVAVGREPGAAAPVDAGEWALEAVGDRVAVTGLRPRATQFRATATSVLGEVLDGRAVRPAGA